MRGKRLRLLIALGLSVLLLLGSLITTVMAAIDTPEEVANINGTGLSSDPDFITVVNNVAYFSADDQVKGRELWRSDGTGASLVRDIAPGAASSSPTELTAVGNTLYFVADDGSGSALWRSDGTDAGTTLVRQINSIRELTNVDGTLFFTADDGSSGVELWRSDGTNGGTSRVRDINPGTESSFPSRLTAVSNRLYFAANNGTNGIELWVSDGTEAGTTLVKDINPGAGSSNPSQLVNAIGAIYFTADDGTTGRELWRSNGTDAGTTQVADINPGAASSAPSGLTPQGTTALIFAADNGTTGRELWRSDGTGAGTTQVRDIRTGADSSSPSGFTEVGSTIYFAANDGTAGTELWRTDGTEAGTLLVLDIDAGSGSSSPLDLTNFSGVLIFSANNGVVGRELWRSDGTQAGTRLLQDINPTGDSDPSGFGVAGSRVIFSAFRPADGDELWQTDGTTSSLVQNIAPGLEGSFPQDFTEFNGVIYFAADDGFNGRELWRSDGTQAGTQLVRDIFPGATGSNPSNLIVVGNSLVFVADDGTRGRELYVTDGTASGTLLLRDINPGGSSEPDELTLLGGFVYFAADDGSTGSELWRTDGTAGGTTQVRDIRVGAEGSDPSALAAVHNLLYFTANNGTNGREPFAYDSNAASPVPILLRDINTGTADSFASEFTAVSDSGNTVLFTAFTQAEGFELYTSDGTPANTALVRDIHPGQEGSFPFGYTRLGNFLYFTADDGSTGFELWRSDGTQANTTRVTDINPGAGDSNAGFFGLSIASNGNRIIFGATSTTPPADNPLGGNYELYITSEDGTSASLLREINATGSSFPLELTNINNFIFFSADDGTTGRELWRSDGTGAGTTLVRDINPGAGSSDPTGYSKTSGGVIYLQASGGNDGAEMWSFNAPPPIITNARNAFLPLVIRAFTPTPTNTPTITPSPTPGITAFGFSAPDPAFPPDQTGSPAQTGAPGQFAAVRYLVQVQNVGQTTASIQVGIKRTCASVIFGCTETFDRSVRFENVVPGTPFQFFMDVALPLNAPLGAVADIELVATDLSNGQEVGNGLFRVRVATPGELPLTLAARDNQPVKIGQPGQNIAFPLRLTNPSRFPVFVNLPITRSCASQFGGCAELLQPPQNINVPIAPGATYDFSLIVALPPSIPINTSVSSQIQARVSDVPLAIFDAVVQVLPPPTPTPQGGGVDNSIRLRGPDSAPPGARVTYDIDVNNFGDTRSRSFNVTIDYNRDKLSVADFQPQSGTNDWYTNQSRPGSAIIEIRDLDGRSSRRHRLTFAVASSVRPGDDTTFRARYPRFGVNNQDITESNQIRLRFSTLQSLIFGDALGEHADLVIRVEPIESAEPARTGTPQALPSITVTPTATSAVR